MVNVNKINEYKSYLEKAFSDQAFLNTYKKSHNLKTKDECINHEYSFYIKMNNFEFYTINDDDKFVGYFGSEGGHDFRYLTTFFIDKTYRNKDFYKSFLDSLFNKLGDVFCAYRYNRNLRAERFLENLGGQALVDTAQYRLYIFKRSE